MNANFLLSQNFFVMDKECTMRVPKARSYGAQPLVRAPKVQLYGHAPACMTGQVPLLVYYIKPKSCLSVFHVCILPFLHAFTSNLLEMKCPSLGNMEFVFKGELTWKIYLCILLPKYVYLFIQCTKNIF